MCTDEYAGIWFSPERREHPQFSPSFTCVHLGHSCFSVPVADVELEEKGTNKKQYTRNLKWMDKAMQHSRGNDLESILSVTLWGCSEEQLEEAGK